MSGAGDPDCTVCAGAGHYLYAVPYGHPQWGKLQRCGCLEASQVAARELARSARAAALTAQLHAELGRLRSCTLDGFDRRRPLHDMQWRGVDYPVAEQRRLLARACGLARDYAATESLYLWGPPGSGKSHLAAAILNAQAQAGVEGRYGSAPAILRLIRQGFRDGSADDRLEALMTVPLLVIDDLGTEHDSSWNDASLFDLVNARYVAERATIVTSNLPVEDHRDVRIVSRLQGGYRAVPVITSDYRALNAAPAAA